MKRQLDPPTLRWVYRELRKWQKHWLINGSGVPGSDTIAYTFGASVDLLRSEARAIEKSTRRPKLTPATALCGPVKATKKPGKR